MSACANGWIFMLRKKFVIVEDNALVASMLTNIIESRSGWKVVGTSGDAYGGARLITDIRPDMVILDLILAGGRDGFNVIESVRKENVDCKFFVISGCGDENMVAKALSMGASYYMKKPYEPDILVERLQDLLCEIVVPPDQPRPEYPSELAAWERKCARFIYDLFVKINVPVCQHGFPYILEALRLARRTPELLMNISGRLYPEVGKHFGVTGRVVERSIRKTIKTIWDRKHTEEYYKLVGKKDDRARPTNGELLRMLTHECLMRFPKPRSAKGTYDHTSLNRAE